MDIYAAATITIIVILVCLRLLKKGREEALKARASKGSINYIYVVSVYDKTKDDLSIHSIDDNMDTAQAKALKISDGSIIITKMMRDETDNIYKKLIETIPKFLNEEDKQ